MRLALTYTRRRPDAELATPDEDADFEEPSTAAAVADALRRAGHDVEVVEYGPRIAGELAELRVDMVFNICEGRTGRNRESLVPAILESLGIPYSGSDPLTLGMTQDKSVAKEIATSAGVFTLRAVTIVDPATLDERHMPPYPLFVKPNHEGCSKGIRFDSLVSDFTALRRQVAWVIEEYRQPALVEEFLPGRELSVGMLGNRPPTVFLPAEILVSDAGGTPLTFYPFELKGRHRKQLACPADVDPPLGVTAAERWLVVPRAGAPS